MQITESTVHNRAIALGETKGNLSSTRVYLLTVLDSRFHDQVPEEYLRIIREQESVPVLKTGSSPPSMPKTLKSFLP